jgi:hypothetical protein
MLTLRAQKNSIRVKMVHVFREVKMNAQAVRLGFMMAYWKCTDAQENISACLVLCIVICIYIYIYIYIYRAVLYSSVHTTIDV